LSSSTRKAQSHAEHQRDAAELSGEGTDDSQGSHFRGAGAPNWQFPSLDEEETAMAPEPSEPQLPDYVLHAMSTLRAANEQLSRESRRAVACELLQKLVQDLDVDHRQFLACAKQIQSDCPDGYSEFASRVLREGDVAASLSIYTTCYEPFFRLTGLIRFQLAADLGLRSATDLLWVDAALEAFTQYRVLHHRAMPSSDHMGMPPGEEELLRKEAARQQSLFLRIMEKLEKRAMEAVPSKDPGGESEPPA